MYHNFPNPIDLRQRPICYLCGGNWGFVRIHRGRLIVKCRRCDLTTCAKRDETVEKTRCWHLGPRGEPNPEWRDAWPKKKNKNNLR